MIDGPHDAWQHALMKVPGAEALERRGDGLWMTAPGLDVRAMADAVAGLGFRLSAITGVAIANGETAILYHYIRGGIAINVRAETRGRSIASIASITPVADWAERELADLYDVLFIGHPNPSRLIRPPVLAPGFFRDRLSQEKT